MIDRLDHAHKHHRLTEIISVCDGDDGAFRSEINTEGYTPEVWGNILGALVRQTAATFEVTLPDGRRLEFEEVRALILRGVIESSKVVLASDEIE